MHYRILIIEDDQPFGIMLKEWFKRHKYEAELVPNMERARKELVRDVYHLVISDMRLPDGDGIELLGWLKDQKKELPVMMMTSYAEVQSAVQSIKLGAVDYMEKPINPSILKQKVEQALESKNTSAALSAEKNDKSGEAAIIKGNSQLARKMYERIELVAPTRMAVLIVGESGAGKEHVARMIHDNSSRKNMPFIAVDCGSLMRELALSELFGHVKGAFTSAIADKKGVFELANGGTVFLDEVGNLSYEVQVQLLRTLQEQQIHPIGSSAFIKVDVRMLAATNENLETAIANGKFREDLYHRLKEFSLNVPSLRERVEDIPLFVNYFLNEANLELNKDVKGLTYDASRVLESYSWPGNLRELRNVIRSTVLFTQSEYITVDDLPVFSASPFKQEPPVHNMKPWLMSEKDRIEAVLQQANGNKQQAAKLLNISRKTLYNKMHLYGIKL